MKHYISLAPSVGKSVGIAEYVAGIKKAKANPDRTFKHGLNCWWPCTGRDIVNQFYEMVRDHCNRGLTIRKSRFDKWLHSFHHAKKHGRICKGCGEKFFPHFAAQVYCHDSCYYL